MKMKTIFSTKWKASKQRRKQRKYSYNAPLHLKFKELSAPLDKALKKTQGVRNVEVRKGDEVKIMRGKHKGKMGKVDSVDLQRSRVSIDGIAGKKKDGNPVTVWFNPSKLQIKSLKSDDKRFKRNKKSEEKKVEKKNAPKKK